MNTERLKQYQQIDYIKLFMLCKRNGLVKAKRKTPAQSTDSNRPGKALFAEFIKKTFVDYKFKSERRFKKYAYLILPDGHKYLSISREVNNIERTDSDEWMSLQTAYNSFLQGNVGALRFNINAGYYYNNSYISITFARSRKWEELCGELGSYDISRPEYSIYENAILLLQFKNEIEERYNSLCNSLETYKTFLQEKQKIIIEEKQEIIIEEKQKSAQELFDEAARSLGRV